MSLFNVTAEQKQAFAKALVRLGEKNAFSAALEVFGSGKESLGLALWAANELISDAEVAAEKTRLLGPESVGQFLPTKDQTARQAWEFATAGYFEPKERIAALKLYAELQGYVLDKNSKTSNSTLPPAIIYEVDPTAGDEPSAPADGDD